MASNWWQNDIEIQPDFDQKVGTILVAKWSKNVIKNWEKGVSKLGCPGHYFCTVCGKNGVTNRVENRSKPDDVLHRNLPNWTAEYWLGAHVNLHPKLARNWAPFCNNRVSALL